MLTILAVTARSSEGLCCLILISSRLSACGCEVRKAWHSHHFGLPDQGLGLGLEVGWHWTRAKYRRR